MSSSFDRPRRRRVAGPWFTVVAAAALAAAACDGESTKLSAVYYDTYASGEPDEAFRLFNGLPDPADLAGWKVTDGEGLAVFPSGATLAPKQLVWVAKSAVSFASEFGYPPDWELQESDPAVPNLASSGTFTLANAGDELTLQDATGTAVDTVVFEDGVVPASGWTGAALDPYDNGGLGIEGQILYRKLDELTGLPVPDTDTAEDWAQSRTDPVDGRKVQFPGWDLEHFFFPKKAVEPAELIVGVAPDSIYASVVAEIERATTTLDVAIYTLTSAALTDALVERAQAGVAVRILLEGEPAGGIDDQELWAAEQIEAAGGEVWFLFNDSALGVHDRYDYHHAKYMIVDGGRLLVASENFGGSGMPDDDKSDGTVGNRGAYVITTSPGMIERATDIFARDLDPVNHRDVTRWSPTDPTYGPPPVGFVPDRTTGGSAYPVAFPAPLAMSGTFSFEMVQSPDTALRNKDAMLGLVARAGAGHTIEVEQLYEQVHWGPTASNVTDDPNPRLEAYIAAARRGAAVRILLDGHYDAPWEPRSNVATCSYVNGIAAAESLNLACRRASPAGSGIHNKMVLADLGTQAWIHVGSINGSENSCKNNRELAIQVQSPDAHAYLRTVFDADWAGGGA